MPRWPKQPVPSDEGESAEKTKRRSEKTLPRQDLYAALKHVDENRDKYATLTHTGAVRHANQMILNTLSQRLKGEDLATIYDMLGLKFVDPSTEQYEADSQGEIAALRDDLQALIEASTSTAAEQLKRIEAVESLLKKIGGDRFDVNEARREIQSTLIAMRGSLDQAIKEQSAKLVEFRERIRKWEDYYEKLTNERAVERDQLNRARDDIADLQKKFEGFEKKGRDMADGLQAANTANSNMNVRLCALERPRSVPAVLPSVQVAPPVDPVVLPALPPSHKPIASSLKTEVVAPPATPPGTLAGGLGKAGS